MQCILFRCLKCTKFGQLILRKIVKIVATSCQILRLKCTKFDFGCPRSRWGAYSAPPDPLAGFKGGLLLKEGRERVGKRGRGRGRKGGDPSSVPPHMSTQIYAPADGELAGLRGKEERG